jgi:L-malate glycosyltransferase
MRKPRGLIVIHQFRPVTGGAELQAERLAARLVRMGHEMQVLTQFRVPESQGEEVLQGVRVHRVTFPMTYWLNANLRPTFHYFAENRRTYDVLHVQQAFGHAVVAVAAAHCLRKKCIIKIACAGSYGDLSVLSTFKGFHWGIRVLRLAHRIIAISSEVQKELIDWGFSPKRVQRIPNGVDTDFFAAAPRAVRRDVARFILIGRRVPQKGIDTALQAVQMLNAKGYKGRFELKLFGRDFPEHDYRRMSQELGVADTVCFLPHVDDMHRVFQEADSLILPSRGEGMSNSLLEAMSMQLAVIATPVSGTADIIEEGRDGLLISPGDPGGLASRMETIIQDPEHAARLGESARRKVVAKFSLDFVAEEYSRLYCSLRRSARN